MHRKSGIMRMVPRESPQTSRILLLMDLLADHPAQGRTLAEIARHLGVAKATCYPMVTALPTPGGLSAIPSARPISWVRPWCRSAVPRQARSMSSTWPNLSCMT